MHKYSLNGTWQFRAVEDAEYLPVEIPGSVMSGYLANSRIPDPFYRTNEYTVRELFRKDYIFTRKFTLDESNLSDDVRLVCHGLDTIADISVNGKKIAHTDDFHRTYRFELDNLKSGENEITIYFSSPINFIENFKPEPGKEIHYIPCGNMAGDQYLRKAHCMFGWDWGAQLPDAGIWRDIELEFDSSAQIGDVRFEQKHEKKADGQTDVTLKVTTNEDLDLHDNFLSCVVYNPDGKIINAWDGNKKSFETVIENARLWWPNNLGEHPLYRVELKLQNKDGNVLDTKIYKIGLRTFTVSTDKDQWGNEFAFMVNGVKFFSMGADYIPEDTIYSRITRERIEQLIKASASANYNTLRVWGGGYYPSDDFYDLCDEYGLIVWQDLMYACNVYELNVTFKENIVQETIDNVIRLRHHASLGLWCGNNEMESGWAGWYGFCDHSLKLRYDYLEMFEKLLPGVVEKYDGTHFWWPSSPSSGGWFDRPDDDNRGDRHYWDVWHGEKPFTDYRNYYFRFCSEFGFQSFPDMKTIETFAEPEDMNIFSKVMESHQKNGYANGKILHYISANFRYPKNFESVVYISQVLQGMAVKYGVDHWRRNRGRCMGSLYWQLNDSWPVASWSSVDYFGRWKALMYMSRKFYAPLAISICDEEQGASIWLENETFLSHSVKGRWTLRSLDFTPISSGDICGAADAFSAAKLAEQDFSKEIAEYGDNIFLEVKVTSEDGQEYTEMATFAKYKHMDLEEPSYDITVSEDADGYSISVKANTFAMYVELSFENIDVIFNDNYFHIMDSSPVTVKVLKSELPEYVDKDYISKNIKIRSVRESYD